MGLHRPDPAEYGDAYAHYLAVAPDGDALVLHEVQTREVATTFGGLSEAQAGFRYAPGKWSLKDLLQHLTDAERIFAYRCLRLGRGDATPLAGFEEDAYAVSAQADDHSLAGLLADFLAVRAASLTLFRSLGPADWDHRGSTSGKSITARCLPYIMLGHTEHHLQVIRERYLPGFK